MTYYRCAAALAAAGAAGDIANYVAPHTRSIAPAVRSAATTALCAVLLVPEVQAALAAAPGRGQALQKIDIAYWKYN